jgi:hypothetical protein
MAFRKIGKDSYLRKILPLALVSFLIFMAFFPLANLGKSSAYTPPNSIGTFSCSGSNSTVFNGALTCAFTATTAGFIIIIFTTHIIGKYGAWNGYAILSSGGNFTLGNQVGYGNGGTSNMEQSIIAWGNITAQHITLKMTNQGGSGTLTNLYQFTVIEYPLGGYEIASASLSGGGSGSSCSASSVTGSSAGGVIAAACSSDAAQITSVPNNFVIMSNVTNYYGLSAISSNNPTANTNGFGLSSSAYSSVAIASFYVGGGSCSLYYCSTTTYTWTNYACASGVTGCMTTLSSTTIFSTAITQTDCTNTLGGTNGCYANQTTSTTALSTAVSYSVITTTTTSTSTLYQINAPNPAQFYYWLFPFLFMALGISIPIGVITQREGGFTNVTEKVLVMAVLFGAFIGTLAGTLIGLLNFLWPMSIFIILGLWIWKGR